MYRGPYFAIIELQARWSIQVFSQKNSALSQKEIQISLDKERKIRSQKPRPQFPHGDYIELADKFAKKIGSLANPYDFPEISDMLLTGPLIPAQYRLTGINASNETAIKAIKKANGH